MSSQEGIQNKYQSGGAWVLSLKNKVYAVQNPIINPWKTYNRAIQTAIYVKENLTN